MTELKDLKVALVHDWLTGYRGGEKVLDSICELFPNAPLYTLVYQKGSTNKTIEKREIHTSLLQKFPRPTKYYRHYLPFFPLAAETLGVKGYDLIVSTSHAVAKSIPTHGAIHWCFIHSPMRYIWDRFDDYFGPKRVGYLPSKLIFKPIAKALQVYDVKTSSRVNHYAANSHFVANRVKQYYNREAETLYVPVELDRFDPSRRNPEDFYLYFSALVPYKKADHAILACQKMKRKLIVVGKGPELPFLKSIADPQYITFLGGVSDQEVVQLYSKAKALLFPGVEDLGIVPIEASASGLPVIGLKEGGLAETQTDETCLFYSDQTVDELMASMEKFEKQQSDYRPSILRKRAEWFSPDAFKNRVRQSIQNLI